MSNTTPYLDSATNLQSASRSGSSRSYSYSYTKPASSYKKPSSSYSYSYTKPSSSYSYSYTKPSSSYTYSYTTPSSSYSYHAYVAPIIVPSPVIVPFAPIGSYYNYYYGSAYGYSTFGYGGGYYGSGTVYGYNSQCPSGCTVNGFCGTVSQCASATATGLIVGLVFGGICLCLMFCLCAFVCGCCKSKQSNSEVYDPIMGHNVEVEEMENGGRREVHDQVETIWTPDGPMEKHTVTVTEHEGTQPGPMDG